jgi:hypothetical protein
MYVVLTLTNSTRFYSRETNEVIARLRKQLSTYFLNSIMS